jgi:chromosome segregation ATPase
MSEVTVAPELLQQLAHLANAASEPMMVDEGVEMSAAICEIASQVKGRTEILAGAVQSVATSTQGLSDRVKMLEQQLTESIQREQALAERLQVYFKSQEDRQKSLEHTLDRMGTAMASMQQAMTAMQASLDEHRTSMKDMGVSARSANEHAELRFSTLEDRHQAAMARMNYLDHRILQTANSQQGQVETSYLSPTTKPAQPEHFL